MEQSRAASAQLWLPLVTVLPYAMYRLGQLLKCCKPCPLGALECPIESSQTSSLLLC